MDRTHPHIRDLPSFTAESTLGRLAKWLRLAGFDVALDHAVPEADGLMRISGDAGRIILTRTLRVFKTLDPATAILIRHNHIEDQLRQVIKQCGIQPDDLRPLTICATCNQRLIPADKDDMRHHVPQYIWHHHESFFKCPRCQKVYWPGTHVDAMKTFMRRCFGENG